MSDKKAGLVADGVCYEFYAPFAHIPGRYEWCRIHSPTHGSFDCFIVIETDTVHPVTVYVCAPNGARFMADRFPESSCIVVGRADLSIDASEHGRRISGSLSSAHGPVARAEMLFEATQEAVPIAEPYGGGESPVWGGRFSCEGVDLNVAATVTGYIATTEGGRSEVTGMPAIIALGSYGALRSISG